MLPRYQKSTVVVEKLRPQVEFYKRRDEDELMLQAQRAPNMLQPRPSTDKAVLAAFESAKKFQAIQDQRLNTLRRRDKMTYELELDRLRQEAAKTMPTLRDFAPRLAQLDELIMLLTQGMPTRPPTSFLSPEDLRRRGMIPERSTTPERAAGDAAEEAAAADGRNVVEPPTYLKTEEQKELWRRVIRMTRAEAEARYGPQRPLPISGTQFRQPNWAPTHSKLSPSEVMNTIKTLIRSGREDELTDGDRQFFDDYNDLTRGGGRYARGSASPILRRLSRSAPRTPGAGTSRGSRG
jgi:hypothetical protein